MTINTNYHSDLAIPPGEYLEEVIAELGLSKEELAQRMNRPAAKLSAIYKGDKAITPETALQLEKVTGVPAHVWIGLETEYRLILAREKEKEHHCREKEYITKFCYNDLVKYGFVDKTSRCEDKITQLYQFFGVTSLETIRDLNRYKVCFRAAKTQRSPEALVAWLRMGELRAREIHCRPFDAGLLKEKLPLIRKMTSQLPEEFIPVLKSTLVDAGVAFVVIPHLPKTYAHGATYWINKQKAALLLSLRGSWADIFWFSLFHELGHILLHDSRYTFIEGEENELQEEQYEREADTFAATTLIPPQKLQHFLNNEKPTKQSITDLAKTIGIHPGIIVGRLQHEKIIENTWFNDLRKRYKWEIN
ncbi:MAG TPA: HigA family addiction module antitoxin [bacterium]|nr:HigA family addiction module antitoxin [bacterium]HPN45903.1 HigA family addiction module antitoxin [bacterium]